MAAQSRLQTLFNDELDGKLDESWLVLRADYDPIFAKFANATFVQSFKPSFDTLEFRRVNAASFIPKDAVQNVLVQITRDKSENRALINHAWRQLSNNGVLVVDGLKSDGIESLFKECRKIVSGIASIPKAHGRIFWFEKNEIDLELKAPVLSPKIGAHGFYSHAGMFSPDKIDAGSEFLFENLGKISGHVADFGAGWGYLSARVIAQNAEIESLDLFEAEKTALDCAKLNVKDARVRFHWEDITKLDVKNQFDHIIMNPPFHESRKADINLGRSFIEMASRCLHPKGKLWMVANRQLAYEVTLNDCFSRWEEINKNTRFKLITARAPKRV